MAEKEPSLPTKLIMSWDIAPERDQEYFEFVVREFLPAIQTMGFDITEAWATVYGERPQIQVGVVMPDTEKLLSTITSDTWKDLHGRLLEYVVNYQQKIVRSLTRFQF